MKKLCELKKLKNFNVINFAVPIIDLLCPIKHSPNKKYDNEYFLICLLDFIDTHVSWNKYKGPHDHPIKGKYLNQIHNKYVKKGVYCEIHRQLVNKYLQTDRESKLKGQIIDSTFTPNKGGSVKNNNHLLTDDEKIKNQKIKANNLTLPRNKQIKERTFISFNRYNGRKKYFKPNVITDSYGVPLATSISSSKQVDSSTLIDLVEKLPPNLHTLRNSKVNRYQQYFLADSGYDTKKNKEFLKKKGYIALIKYNKRNCKNKATIKRNTLTGKHKKIYKKRPIVECFYAWIKNKPVINQNYQKTIESYNGLFLLACSKLTSTRIYFLRSKMNWYHNKYILGFSFILKTDKRTIY